MSRPASPVVATVLRSGREESLHRGFGAVAGPGGALLARFGEPETPVYWRSAAKPFQVLPLLEAGGEKEFSLTGEEIAVACASHGGEPRHASAVRGMLARGGFTGADLRCGAHPPTHEASAAALARAGEAPSAVHNNCSGKHAAMLLACRLHGFDPGRYEEPGHRLQKMIRARIAFYSLYPEDRIEIGVDGCSLPVFRLPISRLAAAYARLLAPPLEGESREASAARRRVAEAMTSHPSFVAGAGRFTTAFLAAGRGRWIGKEGAEGVYAVASNVRGPEGFALKIEDGGTRARDAVTLDVMRKMGELPEGTPETLRPFERPGLRNARGLAVGEIVADVPLERLGPA